ncbi:MAG: Ig-like domain-containing protein, partial [Candidatus Micrarchaeota archaeon]|nr:Ig-like domain-containing protein [Candidatus Micrarchaeota archaeon]
YLELSPSFASLIVNRTQVFTAVLHTGPNGRVTTLLDPRALRWSSLNNSVGTIQDGTFTARSEGNTAIFALYDNILLQYFPSANATVQVNPAPLQNITNNTNDSIYLELSPSFASLYVNETQNFTAILHTGPNGNVVTVLSPGSVGWGSWNTSVGTIQNGIFTARSEGRTSILAIYGNLQLHLPRANATVQVNPAPLQNITNNTNYSSYLEISPANPVINVGDMQNFTAIFHSGNGSVASLPASSVNWLSDNTSVGTIDQNGIFTANSSGYNTVGALYSESNYSYSASTLVTVNPIPAVAPNNGNGGNSGTYAGSGNGGGSFKTSTVASFSCSGKSGSVKITYFVSGSPEATVEVIYLGENDEKVLKKIVSGTSTFGFTPQKEGRYEVRVSLGVDQSSAYFTVPACTGENAFVQQNVTVQLQPKTEIILSKTIRYENGFTKKFEVYRTTDGSIERYNTEITLTYTGTKNLYNVTVLDSVPKSIVSGASQIAFGKSPTRTTSGDSIGFEWGARSIVNGEKVTYSYSFARPLTASMIDAFAVPSLLVKTEIPSSQGGQDIGSMISASIGALGGFSLPLVIVGFVLVAAVTFKFITGRNKV